MSITVLNPYAHEGDAIQIEYDFSNVAAYDNESQAIIWVEGPDVDPDDFSNSSVISGDGFAGYSVNLDSSKSGILTLNSNLNEDGSGVIANGWEDFIVSEGLGVVDPVSFQLSEAPAAEILNPNDNINGTKVTLEYVDQTPGAFEEGTSFDVKVTLENIPSDQYTLTLTAESVSPDLTLSDDDLTIPVVEFAPGEYEKIVTIQVNDDAVVEGLEESALIVDRATNSSGGFFFDQKRGALIGVIDPIVEEVPAPPAGGGGGGGSAPAPAPVVNPPLELVTPAADRLIFDDSDNVINGLDGSDYIRGMGGNDQLFGGNGADFINGNFGDDFVHGNKGADEIRGGAGNDEVRGGMGHDKVFGGNGHDQLFGGSGFDELVGGRGADLMHGGSEDDILFGGAGHDVIHGDNGNDQLFGGMGNDILVGGEGSDIFHLTEMDDVVSDFQIGIDNINTERVGSVDWKLTEEGLLGTYDTGSTLFAGVDTMVF